MSIFCFQFSIYRKGLAYYHNVFFLCYRQCHIFFGIRVVLEINWAVHVVFKFEKCNLIILNNLVVNCCLLSRKSSVGYDNCKSLPCGDNVTDSLVISQFFYVLQNICLTMSSCGPAMKIDLLGNHNTCTSASDVSG